MLWMFVKLIAASSSPRCGKPQVPFFSVSANRLRLQPKLSDVYFTQTRTKPLTQRDAEMDQINALCLISQGWTESRAGGMLVNPKAGGAIIDVAIASREWFIIFNDHRETLKGFASREDAIESFAIASRLAT